MLHSKKQIDEQIVWQMSLQKEMMKFLKTGIIYSKCRNNPTTYLMQTLPYSHFNEECRGKDSESQENKNVRDLSIKTYWPTMGDFRRYSFHNTLRNKFVKGAPESLKSSMTAFSCKPKLTGGTTATLLENINAVRVIRSGLARAKWLHSTQRQDNVVTIINSRVKAAIKIDWQMTLKKKQWNPKKLEWHIQNVEITLLLI